MDAVQRMILSLKGLSVGDAFGETFFNAPAALEVRFEQRTPAPPPWRYTDDTLMALSIVALLMRDGRIDPDALAADFVARFDPTRNYGAGAVRLLIRLRDGADWRVEAPAMFNGAGSYGNGAAMRVAPLGAYFADDLDAVRENAVLSAQPTHAHPEGEAGAVAVAVAVALAWQVGEERSASPEEYLKAVAAHTPDSAVRTGVLRAAAESFDVETIPTRRGFPLDVRPARVAALLGAGAQESAQDTVPFALWCAARHADDYQEALWATAGGGGDVDTTCAIVGGIVACSARRWGVPPEWSAAREPLPLGFE
ncbi:MAG TPA: ADP-ribosylglycohydrolase family protein [Acidobacteriota bacterium]|nr:ADP-ribosylglycohydrolase family protein [Acidobacteriota bacterium]